MLGSLGHDLRDAVRSLRRHKLVTVFASLSIAIAIGADSTLVALLDELALKTIPARDPAALVRVYPSESDGQPWGAFSYPQFRDVRAASKALDGLAVEAITPVNATSDGRSERRFGALVSGDYFAVLGLDAQAGRLIRPTDERVGEPSPVVVLADGYWRRRFGASAGVVGTPLHLNGHAFTIVGVAPPGFRGTTPPLAPDLFVPITADPLMRPERNDLANRGGHSMLGIGRLAPGATVRTARAELAAIAGTLARTYPASDSGITFSVIPESEGRIFPAARGPIFGFFGLLFAVITLVLLIACANVAGLLLARGESRRRELGVRAALGAGRGRLVRQLLVESAVLGLVGGAGGFLLAQVLTRLIAGFRPPVALPISLDVQPDARVLVFALGLGLLASVAFGLLPALRATRADVLPMLRDGNTTTSSRSRLRGALVVAQVAVSLLLIAVAGLALRALGRAETLSPGFDVERLAVASIDLPLSGYTLDRARAFQAQALERIRRLPGIESAEVTNVLPLGLGGSSRSFAPEGQPVAPGQDPEVGVAQVGPDYFRTMGIGLVRGRTFTSADRAGAPPVVVVNEAAVRRYWNGRDPIGRRATWNTDGSGPYMTVIGVVRTGKYVTLGEAPRPFVYMPYAQGADGDAVLIARSRRDPELVAAQLERAVKSLDPNVLVFDAKSMASHMGISLLPVRFASALLGAMGVVALLLAGIGLFAVVAYTVSRRTREIGVRMALGATRESVLRMMFGEGLRLALAGMGLGLAAALAVARLASGFLYGVGSLDPLAFTAALAALGGVVLIACGVPAYRAARVDPLTALRHD